MATLIHCTGYPLDLMLDDYNGQVDASDIETIAVEAALSDLPDILEQERRGGRVPGDDQPWPEDAIAWVKAWDGKSDWAGSWSAELDKGGMAGIEVVVSLYWP